MADSEDDLLMQLRKRIDDAVTDIAKKHYLLNTTEPNLAKQSVET